LYCAVDIDSRGLACVNKCEGEVKAIIGLVNKSRKYYEVQGKTFPVNVLLCLFAGSFIIFQGFGMNDIKFSIFFWGFGGLLIISGIRSWINKRKTGLPC
jgi:ABC-type xylose transport system permease subunit